MKKLFFAVIFTAIAMTSINAQKTGLGVGVNLGLPIGDAADAYTLNFGLDVNYLFELSDALSVGGATGYSHTLGDNIETSLLGSTFSFDIPDFQFIPVAAAGRFLVSDQFTVGADLGYAVGVNEGNDGGVYYRPMVGYDISESMAINAYYTGISTDGDTFSTFNVGIMFRL